MGNCRRGPHLQPPQDAATAAGDVPNSCRNSPLQRNLLLQDHPSSAQDPDLQASSTAATSGMNCCMSPTSHGRDLRDSSTREAGYWGRKGTKEKKVSTSGKLRRRRNNWAEEEEWQGLAARTSKEADQENSRSSNRPNFLVLPASLRGPSTIGEGFLRLHACIKCGKRCASVVSGHLGHGCI